jgi:hypothetical protein
MSWTNSDYSKHPRVLQHLRTTFSNGFGLPEFQTAAERDAAVEAAWEARVAADAAAKQQVKEREAAKQELLKKYMPYQVGCCVGWGWVVVVGGPRALYKGGMWEMVAMHWVRSRVD